MRLSVRAQAALAAAAAVALALPFLTQGLHVDEPFFLDRARELLEGRTFAPATWADYNNNPPMILWLLAAALKLGGGSVALARALLLPLDAAAAACLCLLFGRFLKAPLAWTLLVVLSPAWTLNMGHLMAEKPGMAFALAGLYALVVGADEGRPAWLAASAVLLSGAALSKYAAAAAAYPAAAWYLWRSGARPRRLAWWLALALAAPALYLLSDAVRGGLVLRGVSATLSGASAGAWSRWPHRARALLCFFGGLSVLPMAWPLASGWPRRWALAAAAALLFLPVFDSAPVAWGDRLFGAWLAAGAAGAAWAAV